MIGQEKLFGSEELDILHEIMNIAFGNAAADLAEVINIYVRLSVPDIRLLSAEEISGYIKDEVTAYNKISMVEQAFWGEFKGSAFLAFPAESGKMLISFFGEEEPYELNMLDCSDTLERETLLEIGNILIGACVGKVAELLGDLVTYSPPTVILGNHPNDCIPHLFAPNHSAVVLKTLFSFKERDVNGFLFLVTANDSAAWIKTALAKFMEQYE